MSLIIGSLMVAGILCYDPLVPAYYERFEPHPFAHKPGFSHSKYITDDMDMDIEMLIKGDIDYVSYADMFTYEFVTKLRDECMDIEQRYSNWFIDSHLKYGGEQGIPDTPESYVRLSKVFWLTFLDQEDHMKRYPYLQKFKDWTRLLKATIDKHLYPKFEVNMIEQQYLLYENGGKFLKHLDTWCRPLERTCVRDINDHPRRLLTYLIYLNPGWTEADGGTLTLYERGDNSQWKVQEVVPPLMGNGVLFRSDKVQHSADISIAQKRAITLFVIVKEVEGAFPVEKPEYIVKEQNGIGEDEVKQVMDCTKRALKKYSEGSDVVQYLKSELDSLFGKHWHCIIGKDFGHTVAENIEKYVYYDIGDNSFYVYK